MRAIITSTLTGILFAGAALAGETAKPTATSNAAPAAAAAPAGPPAPAPELAANMKAMAGNWKCSGKTFATPFGPEHATNAKISFKSELAGHFWSVVYAESKSKDNAMPIEAHCTLGWDPSKKTLMRTDVDNMGGVTHMSSKGWEGDKLVFTGEMMAGPQKMQTRETIAKKSDKEWMQTFELTGPDGKWMTVGEVTCKR